MSFASTHALVTLEYYHDPFLIFYPLCSDSSDYFCPFWLLHLLLGILDRRKRPVCYHVFKTNNSQLLSRAERGTNTPSKQFFPFSSYYSCTNATAYGGRS